MEKSNYEQLVKALRCKRDDCEGCDLAFFDKDEGWMCQYAAKDDDAAAAIEGLQAEVKELRRLNMELFDDLPKYGERFFCWVSMDEDKPKHDGQYITYNTDGFIYWNWWDKFGWAYSASDVLYWMKIDPPTPKGFVKSKCQKCGKAMLTPAIVFDPEAVRICPNCGAKMNGEQNVE